MRRGSGSFSIPGPAGIPSQLSVCKGGAVCLRCRSTAENLAVFGIGGKLLAVIIGASPLLAPRSAADHLPRLKSGWLENLITIPTPPLDHTGVCHAEGFGNGFRTFYSVDTTSPPMARFNLLGQELVISSLLLHSCPMYAQIGIPPRSQSTSLRKTRQLLICFGGALHSSFSPAASHP